MAEYHEIRVDRSVDTFEDAMHETRKAIRFLEERGLAHFEAVSLAHDLYDLGFNRAVKIVLYQAD